MSLETVLEDEDERNCWLILKMRSDGGIRPHRKCRRQDFYPERDTGYTENVKQSNFGIKNSCGN